MQSNRTKLWTVLPLLLLLAAAVPAVRAQVETPTYKKSALVRVDARVELKAPIAQVWAALVSPQGLAALTGNKPDGIKGLAKLGDATAAMCATDKGNFVCTHAVEGKELRITFEPENASYLCENRITLESISSGSTRLVITDRYSDDQADTVDKTAKEVVAEMTRHLAAFQAIAEKH
jgi:uncharacterized protein YndB with AHSA1/START domain